MFLAAAMRRAAYDPETVSMLSSVLERAIAALPNASARTNPKLPWHQTSLRQPPGASETPFGSTR